MRSKIDLLEDESFWENDSNDLPPDDIFAFNELRSCADLYRMNQQKILDIQPEFQRDFVWKNPDQTRFIDSLIKQLPIPSLCFSYDAKQQKWLVIDGLQRISTIIRFLEGADWKLAKLEDINPDIAGVSAAAIKNSREKLHEFYTRVENSTIPITVLRCDYSNKKHLAYLFTIFHRLNSTGLKLNNQEIRNCIYAGSFNRLLRVLDEYPKWRKINKMKKDDNYRMQKQELILRFFAFSDSFEKYTGSLSKFLNDYMESKRFLEEKEVIEKRNIFIETTDIVFNSIFDHISKNKFSITLQDALFVGIARNIEKLRSQNSEFIKNKLLELFKNEMFSETSLSEGLAQKQKMIDRMKKSCELLG